VADYERGAGRVDAPAGAVLAAPGPVTYGRGFLDVRRYNRLAPNAQLTLRLVLGGWVDGDPLPLQRRLSVGGPGTIPGFDFRRATGSADVQQCSRAGEAALPGSPALCDRVALAQVEYRGDLGLNIDPFGALRSRAGPVGGPEPRRFRDRLSSQWVVFFDAGRGWRVGERGDGISYPRGAIPSLRTFRSDVGVGVLVATGSVFDQLGVYVAKAVSDAAEPANVVVRLRRRF
jgi:hypothetical protein